MPDITYEIKFKTARSGGKGGQNVNKVETMVEGYWHIATSVLVNDEEKALLEETLKEEAGADKKLTKIAEGGLLTTGINRKSLKGEM